MKKYQLFMFVALCLVSGCGGSEEQPQPTTPVVVASSAPTPDAVIETIDPCGPSGNDEVIMRLADGKLLMVMVQDRKSYMTELSPGKYMTTDAQRCKFTVEADLTVTW